MRLIIFPLHAQVFPVEPCTPNWHGLNSIALSQTLKCVVQTEKDSFYKLRYACREQPNLYNCAEWTQRQGPYQHNTFQSFRTVFEEDNYLLFNRQAFTVQHYAIVLVQNNQYLGHIYAWKSPLNSKLCFAMGIRGRVDALYTANAPKGISKYLMEGLRVFALIHGCDSIVVPYPVGRMQNILEHYGFELIEHQNITPEIIGNSLGQSYVGGYCKFCFVWTMLGEPLIAPEELSYTVIN